MVYLVYLYAVHSVQPRKQKGSSDAEQASAYGRDKQHGAHELP
jgi:hypothetical protein